MKITIKNMMQINITCDERVCLEVTNEVLGEILNYLEDTHENFENGTMLYNPATGEFVKDEEIMRTRGILQFFLDNLVLEVQL